MQNAARGRDRHARRPYVAAAGERTDVMHGVRDKARAQDSSRLADIFAAARRHHQAGQFPDAQKLYEHALRIEPEHFGSLYAFGILALQTGRPGLAADLVGRAVARRSGVPDAHYHLALALEMQRRHADAAAHYRRAVAIKPDYAEAHMNLGNVLVAQGEHGEAIACYERVLALDTRSAVAHYNLGNVLATLMRLAEAETHLRAAIALDGAFAQACNNLGNVLRDHGRGAEAEDAYRRALALRPDYADAHNNLGVMLAARGALGDAIAQYRQAIRLRPDFVAALDNLGLALSRAGDSDAAIDCFRRALAVDPDGLDALHHLARELFARGEAAAAVRRLAPALDRNATAETRSIFVQCLRGLPDDALDETREHVLRALAEGWAHNGDLEQVCMRLIKRSPAMAACIAFADIALPWGVTADLVPSAA
jgi:tetratricopeptide (TPR) repeat protein